MCMSILRAPMLQPPGMATIAFPKRESRGPRTAVDARICATRWYGVSQESTAEVSILSSCSFTTSMLAPMFLSTLPITWTSAMLGTLVSVVTPGAIMVAAMSLRAEFLAPSTCTSPVTRCPPSI